MRGGGAVVGAAFGILAAFLGERALWTTNCEIVYCDNSFTSVAVFTRVYKRLNRRRLPGSPASARFPASVLLLAAIIKYAFSACCLLF